MSNRISRRAFLRNVAFGAAGAAGATLLDSAKLRSISIIRAAEQVTLEFWNTFSTAEIDLLHKYGDEYMKLNPNIKINFYEIPFDQRATKVPTAVETDTLPDILRADYPYQYYLAGAGKLLPLDDALKGWDMRDAIYDIAWKDVTYKGQIMAIPQDKFTSILCYNVDKFKKDGVKEFPKTWDELVEACKKMTHGDEYGIALKFGGGIDWELRPLIWQAGGDVFTPDGQPLMDSPEGAAAMQFAVDLANKYKVMPKGVANFAYGETDDLLKSGKLGIACFGSWQIANYREAKVPWQLGIASWPAGPKGNKGTLSNTGFYMVMNTSQHQKEAVDLLKWIVSKENALRWAKTLDHEPIDKFAEKDSHFQQPIFAAFTESLQWAHIPAAMPRYNAVSKAMDVAAQKALLGQLTAKEAMAEIAAETKKSLG